MTGARFHLAIGLAVCLLLLGQAGPDTTGLSLELEATKRRILTGEPVKLLVTWSTTTPIDVRHGLRRVLIDDGSGFREHRESSYETDTTISAPFRLLPDGGLMTMDTVGASGSLGSFALAFPGPGSYRLRVDYGDVSSNEETIRVRTPRREDAELFTRYVEPRPELVSVWAATNLVRHDDFETVERILAEFEGSPYLDRMRLLYWQELLVTAFEQYYATGGPDRGADPMDELPGQVLVQIEDTDMRGSSFDDDRLAFVARARSRWNDVEGARRLYAQILERHPDGLRALEARRYVDGDGDDDDDSDSDQDSDRDQDDDSDDSDSDGG